MGDTEFDDGIIDNFKVENNRVSFKLNNKTYACFEKQQNGDDNVAAQSVKKIYLEDSSKRVAIEFYTNEKDGKTYRNLTKIEIAENQSNLVSKEDTKLDTPKEINGAEFGLCCHLAQRMTSALGEPFNWEDYEERVKKFYETNKKIKGELK